MAERVNAHLSRELEKFGKGGWKECFHCGNCTAICPLSEQGFLFPRKSYLALQMGLTDSLAGGVEPWLCYYCGDCSDQCPRDANPGEIMMVLRRYLTSVYDWTGLSKKFYTSHWWELGAIVSISAVVTLLFGFINPHGIVTALTPEGGVRINAMFPVKWVHLGDWIMAAGISIFLVSNILRMWYFSVYRDPSTRVGLSTYVSEFKNLPIHFASQLRFSKCEGRTYWACHWLLMTGYITLFSMIVLFLPWFQTDRIYPWYYPQRLFGYYATIGLLAGLIFFGWGRIRKSRQVFTFSHVSDWLFLIMLFLTTLTGILLHFLRVFGLPAATYYMYIIHMAVLVPMLVVEVPFSKWSHLAYRPFAVYFAQLKKRQQEIDAGKSRA